METALCICNMGMCVGLVLTLERKVFLYSMAEALAVKVQKLLCLFLFLFPWKLKSSPTKLNEVF